MKIFNIKNFQFPYNYTFPGQGSDENMLYITRENKIMLRSRQTLVVIVAITLFGTGLLFSTLSQSLGIPPEISSLITLLSLIFSVLFFILGTWWTYTLWKKSVFIMTNKRLVKFIQTTPFNRHSLSVELDMIVDTGAYTKGFLQAFFKLGTLTTRSSAASSGVATDDTKRVNKKYFYVENIKRAEDLQHYVNKVLSVYRKNYTKLQNFRPFIPELKGEQRKEFMRQYPEYWS